jgi:3-hydroxyisobutyrate dehydrogenase-like beta-hydroxyacid dehydrogenase
MEALEMSANGLSPEPTIGILYPGEMGSALGKALLQGGFRVLTTLEGRSERTGRLSREAGIAAVDSLQELAQAADIVLSVVPPPAAVATADAFLASRRMSRRQVYVDLNSIALETAVCIATRLGEAGVGFVDGKILGLAAQLRTRGTLFLSGPSAAYVAKPFERFVRVKVMGDAAGTASAFGMMLSGMTKGVVALFLEMSIAARHAGLLEDLLACYRECYPGIMAVVDRLLPTYPQHAGRRGEELREVERTLLQLGLQPALVRGARQLITEFARLELPGDGPEGSRSPWSVTEVVEAAFAGDLLRKPCALASAG